MNRNKFSFFFLGGGEDAYISQYFLIITFFCIIVSLFNIVFIYSNSEGIENHIKRD